MIIEDFNWSIVDPNTRLDAMDIHDFMKTRRANINITQVAWITRTPSINNIGLYNTKTSILIWKN